MEEEGRKRKLESRAHIVGSRNLDIPKYCRLGDGRGRDRGSSGERKKGRTAWMNLMNYEKKGFQQIAFPEDAGLQHQQECRNVQVLNEQLHSGCALQIIIKNI